MWKVCWKMWKTFYSSPPVENPSVFSTPPVEPKSLGTQGIPLSFHIFFSYDLLLRIKPYPFPKTERETEDSL